MVKLIFLLFFIPYSMYASVLASLNSNRVELGEMVTYSLNLSGADITRPTIMRLCNTDVISTSTQTSINMINGEYTKSFILSYKFIPQQSCEIKATEVDIDGKIELSNTVSLKVVPVSGAKDRDFILELSSDKDEVLVGETFHMTLLFKQKRGANAVDSEFIAPALKGFWIKNESKPKRYDEGDYSVSKVIYTMSAQRVGTLDIDKAQMRIASRVRGRDAWGAFMAQVKWKTYFSNSLSINVSALPSGVNLVGNFSISVSVDKTQIDSNEAVNVNIKVMGDGNLEDIKSFKPSMNDANIFDEKINIESNTLTQKMAFVSDNDFIIPSFYLKYYDQDTKEIKTISTKEIAIKVKNAQAKEQLTIKREEVKSNQIKVQEAVSFNINNIVMIEIFLLGVVIGLVLMYFKPWSFKVKEKIISIKDEKLLLVKLLPYKDDIEVKSILDILENNLYSDNKNILDKKLLKELLKKYKIT